MADKKSPTAAHRTGRVKKPDVPPADVEVTRKFKIGSGAGRPKGARDKNRRLTDEQRKQLAIAAGGITPLEFACSVLRDIESPMDEKKWACELLMPYMHRKLPTAVDMTTNSVVTTVSAEALAAMPASELEKLVTAVLKITESIEI